MFAGIPAVLIGSGLLLATIALVLWIVARRPDRLTLLVGLAVLALAFFVVPTRVHERYGYPVFALGVILAAVSVRWRPAYVALSAATFANMYVVLTTLYPDNPSIDDWLGIGNAIKSPTGVTIIALVHGLAFVWALFQLRRDAVEPVGDGPVVDPATGEAEIAGDGWPRERDGLAPDPAASGGQWPSLEPGGSRFDGWEPRQSAPATDSGPSSSDPTRPAIRPFAVVSSGPSATAPAPLPTWRPRPGLTELGVLGWLRTRLGAPPTRPDRSARLAAERGGRLDRLDLWLVVVLVLASLLLRTFRLAEPYQMHFDEVYHARTATEFLQDWRYGIEHDIYEWTHPHLAKYAMAAGLVLWGGDEVRATSALGVPVRAAVIEPRQASPTSGGARDSGRLHVATGSEIRTYDLRTGVLRSVVPADGASALAFDATGQQLIVGYDDGRVATLDTTMLGDAGLDHGPEPIALATVDHPITQLLESDDRTTVVAVSADRLSLVDLAGARVSASLDFPGIADLASGGSGSALVATVAEVVDPSAVAAKLAELLGGAARDYQIKLADSGAAATVVLGDPGSGDVRTAVDAALADGSLPGVAIEDVARIAVATSDGVAFVDTLRGAILSTISLTGGAHGLAVVTGLDGTKLYVTSGDSSEPAYSVIAIAGDSGKAGPTDLGSHPLPGPGSRVVYDESSQQVHILGQVPGSTGSDADPWTVYVVEPHGNAVYADARLPRDFRPVAWAADIEPTYPADDPQQLLVFDGAGATAEIGIGSHAFAWRLPGVIGGALTAGLLFLLARILFRRRLVAVLTGLFVLVDGMFFVQSRIGMNDVYVGLFIVAAYTLFAALWTGWLRGRLAFWLAMPAIGLLLGLALASKWVAAYAIGALLLLILVRSALGRVLAILGLIAITGVLGYIAISVPEGAGFGNLTFLLIMVALTLVAVVVAVLHPIAWTDEEMWFAALVPGAVGAVVFFGALGIGRLDSAIALGSLAVTPLQLAVVMGLASPGVVALFWLGGRLGFGPLATSRAPDDLTPARSRPPRHRRLAAARLGSRPAGGLGRGLPGGAADRGLRGLVPALGDDRGSSDRRRLASRSHRPDPARPDRPDVPLPQRPGRGPPGVVAVVGVAARPQAGLVLPGGPRRRDVGVGLRRGQPRDLVAGGPGHGVRGDDGVQAAEPRPGAHRDRVRRPVDPVGADRSRRLPVPLLHGAAVRRPRPGLLRGRAVARRVAPRTWLLARVAAAVAIAGPAIMWTLSRPLCGFVNVLSVNPGSQACPAVIPTFIVTARSGALTMVVGVGLIVILVRFLDFGGRSGQSRPAGPSGAFGSLLGAGLVIVAGLIAAALLPDAPVLTLTSIPVEPIALIVGAPLAYLAFQVIGAADPRRFVAGVVVAAVGWFAVLYPNIAALPLPATIVNAYQGILPTYLYAFQFPVSTVTRGAETPLFTPTLAILLGALVVTCLVVAYSASVWRTVLAESAASRDGADIAGDPDDLARIGGA